MSLKRGKGEKLGMRGEIDLLLLHASKALEREGGGKGVVVVVVVVVEVSTPW